MTKTPIAAELWEFFIIRYAAIFCLKKWQNILFVKTSAIFSMAAMHL